MKLSDVKNALHGLETVTFKLENGTSVPAHFHVTEVGMINKHFIDCGGTVRLENKVNFQLWSSIDLLHRLKPEKLVKIIELSEQKLNLTDEEIEVEYQTETIGKFGLEFDGKEFILTSTQTNCLASDSCGIPIEKIKTTLKSLTPEGACCTPGGGCC